MSATKQNQNNIIESKFIEKIKFEEIFPPFAEWQEIEFWWEKQIQDLIEFYLRSKWVENYKKNSERFKINCLLGNNWGGKSRLFEYILNPENKKESSKNLWFPWMEFKMGTIQDVLDNNNDIKNYNIILDDFFKASWNIQSSVNLSILSNGYFDKTLWRLYFFLKKKKIILSSWMNILTIEMN